MQREHNLCSQNCNKTKPLRCRAAFFCLHMRPFAAFKNRLQTLWIIPQKDHLALTLFVIFDVNTENFFLIKSDHNLNLLLHCRLKTEPKWKKKRTPLCIPFSLSLCNPFLQIALTVLIPAFSLHFRTWKVMTDRFCFSPLSPLQSHLFSSNLMCKVSFTAQRKASCCCTDSPSVRTHRNWTSVLLQPNENSHFHQKSLYLNSAVLLIMCSNRGMWCYFALNLGLESLRILNLKFKQKFEPFFKPKSCFSPCLGSSSPSEVQVQ